MGLNPVWRKSLAYTVLSTEWRDGANSTEIAAARQLLIRDMKILEAIAPESGAYLNEVNDLNCTSFIVETSLISSFYARPRDMNWTGRSPFSARTTTNSEPSSGNTTRNQSSSFTKVSHQTNGTQISSVQSETSSHWHRRSEKHKSCILVEPRFLQMYMCIHLLVGFKTNN